MANEYRVFTMDGRAGTVVANSAQEAYQAVLASRPDAGAQGVIVRDPSGRESYVSSGFATSDPQRIEQIRGSAMSPGQASRMAIAEQEVAARPFATRAASAIQGVPFVGEYADELTGALFGPEAMAAQRLAAQSLQSTRPVEAVATQLGTGLAASLPIAAMTIPARGMSVGRAVGQGAALGAALGAAEGAISGFGAGEDPRSREITALQRAGTGAALGGLLGAAGPAVGAAIGRGVGEVRQAAEIDPLAASLGLSPPAARVASAFRQFEQGGPAIPTPTVPRSLAETSPEMRSLLDLAMISPGTGRAETRAIIEQLGQAAADDLRRVLDQTLGQPSGVALQQRELMRNTTAERSNIYNDAYARAIDYSTPEGDQLLQLLDRVDPDVLNRANTLMRREGIPSSQELRLEFDAQGNMVGVAELPNVMQIDYITRAIQSRARTMGAEPEDVTTLTRQVRDIRTTLDSLVPEYAMARSRAAEVIGQREAFEIGEDLLSGRLRREDVQMALEGLTPGELANVRSGMRQYIDDLMARVPAVFDPSDQDAREAVRAVRALTTRENADKIRLVLGDDADAFLQEIGLAFEPLAIRSVGGGSQTAPRLVAEEIMGEAAQPGLLERIGSGQGSVQAEMARFLGAGGPTAMNLRGDLANELGPFVARQQAPDSLAQLRAYLDQFARVQDLPEEMLRLGTNAGYITGLAAFPAAGSLSRETGFAPADVRRLYPR